MCRYQAISHAMKSDEFHLVSPDFSSKVFQEIQREPAYLLPQLKPKPSPQPQTNKAKHTKIIALAASTVAVAVLVGQSLRDNPVANSPQIIAATSLPPQQLPISFTKPGQLKLEQQKPNNRQPMTAQFNDYLQAHNSSVYTNGEAVFQPYAKVTSYGQR